MYELLPPQPGFGLFLLPAPDAGDIFFDIESDPFAVEGGLEYLLGMAHAGRGGKLVYKAGWALDTNEERLALEEFFSFLMHRWRTHPGMHIYHFSPYEPAAVKRLVGRHGTREAELDRLLRAGRFIDLLAVTRQGLRVSVESYSLKSLESSFAFTRSMELSQAGAALRRIAWALELAGAAEVSSDDRAAVEAYNRDDCLSTAALRDWLEERRAELETRDGPVPRPAENAGDASAAVEERAADVDRVFRMLSADLPEDRAAWGPGRTRTMAPGPPVGILPPRGQVCVVGVLQDPRAGARGPAGRTKGDFRPQVRPSTGWEFPIPGPSLHFPAAGSGVRQGRRVARDRRRQAGESAGA